MVARVAQIEDKFADAKTKVPNAIGPEGISLLDANEIGRASVVMRDPGGPGLVIGEP